MRHISSILALHAKAKKTLTIMVGRLAQHGYTMLQPVKKPKEVEFGGIP